MHRLNFTDPINVDAQREKARAICNILGGNDTLCHQNYSLSGDVEQSYHCYLNWSPECCDHMKYYNDKYNIDHTRACEQGVYDCNPHMKDILCKYPLFTERKNDSSIDNKLKENYDAIINTKSSNDISKYDIDTILTYSILTLITFLLLILIIKQKN